MVQYIVFSILAAALVMYLVGVRNQYEYKQRMNYYMTRTKPIIVISMYPDDPSVEDRAAHHRYMLKVSGNPFNIPVRAFPYPDIKYKDGQMIDFHAEYIAMAGEFARMQLEQFNANFKTMNATAYSQYIIGQTPPANVQPQNIDNHKG